MKKQNRIQINFYILTERPTVPNFPIVRHHVDTNYELWKKKESHRHVGIKDNELKAAWVYRYFDQIYANLKTIPIETRGKAKEAFMRSMLVQLEEPIFLSTSSQFPRTKASDEEKYLAQNREYSMMHAVGGKEYWNLLFD